MKKLFILSIAALGLAMGVANAADKKFEGFYLGGGASYSKAEAENFDDKPFGGYVLGGYGKQFGKWYLGGEINGGYAKTKLGDSTGSVERDLTYGVAARAGYEVMPGILGYGLVGLEAASAKVRTATGSADVNDYGLRYGIGAEAFVVKNWTVRSEVSFIDWKGKGEAPKSDEVRATVGVGYHF
ncbi:outer membrane beta-barrel protein [Rhizobium sp. MHM7A]|uniref:outer membrane protein n=1 Tax=Rhizobium sp. MHM7A TaxID=2583233 RepID=UPI0011059CB0|nr:outer membrane beta-barrel protein [Rhizobium sp. MHM7A]TLX16864.1 porin family protein [Rhizobium sp. MHM7A]